MTGKKREELNKLLYRYRNAGNILEEVVAWRKLDAFLDSLTVLEISDEEWAARPWAKAVRVLWVSETGRLGERVDRFPDIPRPAPARLTDAEIEERAIHDTLRPDDLLDISVLGIEKVIKRAFAEKARLEAERNEGGPK